MHAFDVLGDQVRRRILELLAEGSLSSGDIVDAANLFARYRAIERSRRLARPFPRFLDAQA